jgi:DNA-binding LacI/PurR family transcriptional regulator
MARRTQPDAAAKRPHGAKAPAASPNWTRPRRPGIKDVARDCGVAPSTVSNALTDRRYVHPETRKRILESATRLGYRASTVARGLRMQRSWSVGLLLASITNPFYPEVARGVEEVVADSGCNLILCNTDYQEDKQDRYVRVLLDRQVDGIIVGSHPHQRHLEDMRAAGVPFVLLNKGHGKLKCDYVGIDNRGGIAKAVEHLAKLGHRRIGFIRGHPMSGAADERLASYHETVARLGLVQHPALIVVGRYDYVSGQVAGGQLMGLKSPPTAIVASSDMMALGAIDAIRLQGRQVPEDISVVGFDDIFYSSLPGVQLTTIRVPKRELGAAATRLLLERIAAHQVEQPHEFSFPAELIDRATTAPVRAAGRHGGGKIVAA